MKTILFIIITISALSQLYAQGTYTTQPSLGAGSSFYAVFDEDGNYYVTGSFNDKVVLGNDTLTDTNPLGGVTYMVKYNSAGDLQWYLPFSGSKVGMSSLQIDRDAQKIYVLGNVYDSLNLDGQAYEVANGHVYVATLDYSGQVLQVRQYHPGEDGFAYQAVLSADKEYLYVSMNFDDTGTQQLGSITLPNTSRYNSFIFSTRLSTGAVQWAMGLESDGELIPQQMLVDGNGDIYVSIFSTESYSINGQAYTIPSNRNGNTIAKISPTGSLKWLEKFDSYRQNILFRSMLNIALYPQSNQLLAVLAYKRQAVFKGTTYNSNAWDATQLLAVRLSGLGTVLSTNLFAYSSVSVNPLGLHIPDENRVILAGNYLSDIYTDTSGTVILQDNCPTDPNALFVLLYDGQMNLDSVVSSTGGSTMRDFFASSSYYDNQLIIGGMVYGPIEASGTTLPYWDDTEALIWRMGVPQLKATGIDVLNGKNKGNWLGLYPNPCEDRLQVELAGHEGMAMDVSVINMQGQIVVAQTISAIDDYGSVDVSNLPMGIYLVRVGYSDGKSAYGKFLKGK